MSLLKGTRLGPYEILAPLGHGGMGEVYRATDTRLDRTVAIKILPWHVTDSETRRQRFEREARALSTLSHPRICALYDVGEQDGVPFLVMEYLEGETLAHRLVRGALPIDQVLRHAGEIAEGLDHAHRHGLVHRDLKPANIMLTKTGVKLLDFGIAKLWAPEPIGSGSLAETRPSDTLTGEGTILGTLQYMAPEQLEGKHTDARADIFAFGAVVHEMTTGQQAFEGESQASVIAAILDRVSQPLSAARRETPPLLDQIVARCLAKDPDDRWQTASDLRQALKWIAEGDSTIGVPPASTRRGWRGERLGWLAACVVLGIASLAALAAAVTISRRASTAPAAVHFLMTPPENASFNQSSAFMAVSPDGRYVAFVASSRDGNATLWVRPLDSPIARQLPGTEGAFQPFWSPDSKSIAFGVLSKFKKIDVASGLPQTVANVPAGGGTWSRDGIIVFQRNTGPLYQVSASGGPVIPVTTLDKARGETRHSWPQFLPDGRHFIYLSKSTQPEEDGAVYVGSLDSTDRVRLLNADSHAAYVPPGYLLFVRGSTLLAQPFDAGNARLTGEPTRIADQVERTPGSLRGAFSASETGLLAYRRIAETELVWFDRGGRPLDSIGPPAHYSNPTLSPDEQRVAVGRQDPETGTTDIWLIELSRQGASRFGPSPAVMPLWSPDGSRIVFQSNRGFYQKASSGNGDAEQLLTKVSAFGNPLGWTHDGSALIYQANRGMRFDLWMLPLAGDRSPRAWHNTEFSEAQGQLSPDGRWMAYISDESRKNEVYVRSFPSGEGKRQVSIDGGIEPTWRRDGKELFYLAPDQNLMSVAVTAGSTFDAASPVPLFKTRMSTLLNAGYTRNQYVVAADGQRILVNQTPPGAPSSPINVVLNWTATLKK